MIFGFGRKRAEPSSEEIEIESILFQGALNGVEVDLQANARLAQAGLVPAKTLISDALNRRAEMLRIEPKGERAVVALFVDGVPYPGARLSKQEALAVTQMIKLLAGLNIKDRKTPQSGGIATEFDNTPYHLLIDTVPVKTGGERLTVRARNLKNQIDTPEEVGFSEPLRERIRVLTSQRKGVVLACGPANSGVTTTAMAVLKCIDTYLYSIFSLTDLGSRTLSHITIPEKVPGESFEQAVSRCMRTEADVIIVDPLRDIEDVQTIFKNAEQVCFVSEFPAKDAADGISRLSQWLNDPQIVASRLSLILSQKLIRLLCPDCKQAYKPNPKLLEKASLPPETKVLYRTPRPTEESEEVEPCENCGSIGYYGRTGLIEAIEVTDPIRELIAAGADEREIKSAARKENMQSFRTDGLRVVAEGRTSLEELQRIFKS